MTLNTTVLSLVLLVAGSGPCSRSSPTTGASGTTQAPAPEAIEGKDESAKSTNAIQGGPQTLTADEFMRDHALEAYDMRKAVIAGQLDVLQRAAAHVASEWTPHLRLNYPIYVNAVRSAARTVQASKSLPDAALALGEMGATCAACNRDVGGPAPSAADAASAPTGDGMAAHGSAEQALWEGLLVPSDASWSRGARTLLEAPELDNDVEEVSLLARRTRNLAREALAASNPRSEVYGRILASCSACHTLVAQPR
jgi:hypothetical protein